MDNKYDSTVSDSMEESLMKAVAIFTQEQEALEAERKIVRPEINTLRFFLFKLLRLLAAALWITATVIISGKLSLPTWAVWLIAVFGVLTLFALCARRIFSEWILIYQRYAPERLRASCLFTPSCSQYMLLAIEKYGAFRGVFKGIRRLCRCHHPNGGVDLP